MSQLVKKTSAAVAVDDNLTTLLDWINIESVSDFTIIINNAGGGSANDITDVQIDTSVDGGVTVQTDQHAGVPDVPIASGKASVETFTETAAFVRIRALCSAGEDTTAEATLLADTSIARVCTLNDVKDRLGLDDTDYDQMINTIILGVGGIFDGYTNRMLIAPATDYTERVTGYGYMLRVKQYPIITITSIKEAWNYEFDDAEELTNPDDYIIANDGLTGVLMRRIGIWPILPETIQIVYRGGYCAAGVAPGSGEYALPADIREAAILQASFIFKRKDDIGLSSVSAEGGSISKFQAIKLLPQVQEILNKYRRLSL